MVVNNIVLEEKLQLKQCIEYHPLSKDFILMTVQRFPTHLQACVTNYHIYHANVPVVGNATIRYVHRPQLLHLCRCVRL